MSFSSFTEAISSKFGKAKFKQEDGKHIAILPQGIRITGNTVSTKVQVNWGSGHMAYATL